MQVHLVEYATAFALVTCPLSPQRTDLQAYAFWWEHHSFLVAQPLLQLGMKSWLTGDTLLLMDQLADEKNTDEVWTEHVALSEAMEKLTEREKKILFLRYYEGKTQTEISSEVGISQAQVSRLEKNALKNIKLNIS